MKRQDVRLVPRRGLEILALYCGLNRIHVAAQEAAGEGCGDEQALAAGGRDGVVHRVVRERRDDAAGTYALQGIRTGDAAEVDEIEIRRRAGALRFDIGDIIAVSNADAREAAL